MGKHFYMTFLKWKHTGTQAEDSKASSDVVRIDKAFQVHRAILFPPYNATGALENLLITLKVDDKLFDKIHLHTRMCAPLNGHGSLAVIIPLGFNRTVDPRYNTCLKGVKTLQVETYGGLGGITGDYEIWLQGDWFEDDKAMQDFFGETEFNPDPVKIRDPFRAHEITIHRPTKLTKEEWTKASAGVIDAPKPRVLPYFTYARNKKATIANKEFPLDIRFENVKEDWMSMYWDASEGTFGVYINKLGVHPHDNLLNTWIEIGGDEYPKGRWITEYYRNELPLPFLVDDAQSKWVREVGREMALLVYEETGDVRIVDNGTSIPADKVWVGLWARWIDVR